MSSIKRTARLFLLICLIVLAGIGIGLTGGVPLPSIKSRKDSEKEDIELMVDQESDAQVAQE